MGLANPQALNRYAYVLNNPMRWTDPGGHSVYMSHEQANLFVQYLRDFARELYRAAKGLPNNVQGILASIANAFGGSIAKFLHKLFLNLRLLQYEQIAAIYALADYVEGVNKLSPDGVAIATGLNSGEYFPNEIYILNRSTGDITHMPMSYIIQVTIFGGGTVWDLGIAFGDDPNNGQWIFARDNDGKGMGPENVCPSEAQSC